MLRIQWIVLLLVPSLTYGAEIPPAARKAIDAGNQVWVEGMKTANADKIAETYAHDAVECSPGGQCIAGRDAILQQMQQRIGNAGKAERASVTSVGAVQQGDLIYEWGEANASYRDGRSLHGRYLTVWQPLPDGSWHILRNLSLP